MGGAGSGLVGGGDRYVCLWGMHSCVLGEVWSWCTACLCLTALAFCTLQRQSEGAFVGNVVKGEGQ